MPTRRTPQPGSRSTSSTNKMPFWLSGFYPGNGFADGVSGAPTGTPQLPSLLSGYAVRPPWNVAGVDYRVGINTGVTLLDPATISTSAGAIQRVGTDHIVLSGNGTVLDGYDLSLTTVGNTGFFVSVTGTNCKIRNCNISAASLNWVHTSLVDVSSSTNNCTVEYSVLDGGGPGTQCTEMLHQVPKLPVDGRACVKMPCHVERYRKLIPPTSRLWAVF